MFKMFRRDTDTKEDRGAAFIYTTKDHEKQLYLAIRKNCGHVCAEHGLAYSDCCLCRQQGMHWPGLCSVCQCGFKP
jgi:hypothetical protein